MYCKIIKITMILHYPNNFTIHILVACNYITPSYLTTYNTKLMNNFLFCLSYSPLLANIINLKQLASFRTNDSYCTSV